MKEGLFLGKEIQISNYFTCHNPVCTIELKTGPLIIARKSLGNYNSSLLPHSHAGPNSHVILNDSLESHMDFSATVSGTELGYLWFKPAFWGLQGLLSLIDLQEMGSTIKAHTFSTFSPITTNGGLYGVIGVSKGYPSPDIQSIPPQKSILF
ncbi:hypothetical protein DSO57_1034807 [Entomophthora muscae]|uniref:Uncharacterized protein n=1 Tax=Entomophthora muscae TaxID=34485 RepID=A0ACC2SZS7_9FUNG|nr:hypothetical protein DSO57_1034807 [Entomophthora muscae]